MKRGDLVSVALSGDFGKPHPALVIQSDHFLETETVVVLLLTSALVQSPLLRISLVPDDANRLKAMYQVMIDKIMTVRRDKVGPVFGVVGSEVMLAVNRAVALVLEFG